MPVSIQNTVLSRRTVRVAVRAGIPNYIADFLSFPHSARARALFARVRSIEHSVIDCSRYATLRLSSLWFRWV